jgi:hypothetical protein
MKIPRIAVQSSQIAAIGYDNASRQLDLEFKSHSKPKEGAPPKPNSVYRYQNVPPELHQRLISAESIGKFFGAEIKPFADRYPFKKLTEAELN